MSDLFEQAKLLHIAGRLEDAVAAYRRVLEAEPQNADAHNMLGNALADQAQWSEAAESYRRAIDLRPKFDDAYFNLGDALSELARWEEAAAAYRGVLDAHPDQPDAEAAFQVARSLQRAGRTDEAIRFYQRAAQIKPRSKLSHAARVTALLEAGQMRDAGRTDEAVQWHRLAVELAPGEPAPHFFLGCTLLAAERFDEAEAAFRRAVQFDPHAGNAYQSLGHVLEIQGERTELAALAEEWLRANPDDPLAIHYHAAWTGQNAPPRASDEYVRATFDHFAPDFDRVLGGLDYRVPQILCSAVAAMCQDRLAAWDILDAGCGTGLCGPLLRPLARRLIGLDLSAQMLDRARQRGVYDELVEAELTAYLQRSPAAFDVLVAADTLVYFGELQSVLAAASGALRARGVFAFTLEHLQQAETGAGFRLQPHGRYSHTEEYVRQILDACGLAVRSLDRAILRREGGQSVVGLVVVACHEPRTDA